MGDLHLVTGYAGKPHVTAADQASLFMGAIRSDSFVMDSGQNFTAEVITNNLIRIYDGEMVIQGRHVKLNAGTYIDVTIENGTQGYLRNDLIVARYAKDSKTGVETFDFAVIKGTPVETDPIDPEYATADINEGTLLHEEPMIRVLLDGLNVCELEVLFVPQKTIYASMFHADGSVPMTGPLDMGSNRVKNVAEPEADTDAATLGYARKVGAPHNLLDNSDFTQFVAQAGVGGSHGTQAYAGDRWILDSGTVTGTAIANGYSGITLNGTIRQKVASSPDACTPFIEMVSGTAEISYSDGAVTITSSGGVIKYAALYEGEYTAETLPEYKPKSYTAELLECMRYFVRFGHASQNNHIAYVQAATTTVANAILPIPAPMRLPFPTIEVSAGKAVLRTGATDIATTSFTVNSAKSGPFVYLAVGTSGLTAGGSYVLRLVLGTLDLSADL